MYNQNYDDYLRSVLGYNNPYANTYMQDDFYYNRQVPNNMTSNNMYTNNIYQNTNIVNRIEMNYPDIYRIAYPMVVKTINVNTSPINDTTIDNMTEMVCSNLEGMEGMEEYEVRETSEKSDENRDGENRVRRPNRLLRDLVKILIIRELLNRHQSFNQFSGGFGLGMMRQQIPIL